MPLYRIACEDSSAGAVDRKGARSTLMALRSRSSQSTSPSYFDRISGSPEHIFSNLSKPIYRQIRPVRATGAVVAASDGVNLNRSPLNVLAEPARFYLLGAFCGGPKSPWGDADDPFEVKTELALVREADTYRDLGQIEAPSSAQDLLRPFNAPGD